MTKRTYNQTEEYIVYRAEKRYANKKWGPAHIYGGTIEDSTPELVKKRVRYYRTCRNWKTRRPPFSGRIRIVKITSITKSHTTVIKEPL